MPYTLEELLTNSDERIIADFQGETRLSLNQDKGFLHKTGTELATAFARIPPGVTDLRLDATDLGARSGAILATAFAGIPPGVTRLNLSHNNFGVKASAKLVTAFAGIPASVTHLDLSHNNLSVKTGTELAALFAGIPASVTHLDLRFNDFNKKTGAELATAFAGIPAGVTHLDLRFNNFDKKTGAELATAFAGIPASVIYLTLGHNDFDHKTGAELATAFAGIPAGVTHLDLSHNFLGQKTTATYRGQRTTAELITAFAGISEHVREITLSLSDIIDRSDDELVALGRALPYAITIHVLDEDDHLVTNASVMRLNAHVGSWFAELGDVFHQLFPSVLSLLALQIAVASPVIDKTFMATRRHQKRFQGSQLFSATVGAAREPELLLPGCDPLAGQGLFSSRPSSSTEPPPKRLKTASFSDSIGS